MHGNLFPSSNCGVKVPIGSIHFPHEGLCKSELNCWGPNVGSVQFQSSDVVDPTAYGPHETPISSSLASTELNGSLLEYHSPQFYIGDGLTSNTTIGTQLLDIGDSKHPATTSCTNNWNEGIASTCVSFDHSKLIQETFCKGQLGNNCNNYLAGQHYPTIRSNWLPPKDSGPFHFNLPHTETLELYETSELYQPPREFIANGSLTSQGFGISNVTQDFEMSLNDMEWPPRVTPPLAVGAYISTTFGNLGMNNNHGHSFNHFTLSGDATSDPNSSLAALCGRKQGPLTTTSIAANSAIIQPQQAAVPATRFACSRVHCNRAFKRPSDLARHITNIHSVNQGIHLCPILGCPRSQGAGYSRADKVTEHLWKKHATLGYVKRA